MFKEIADFLESQGKLSEERIEVGKVSPELLAAFKEWAKIKRQFNVDVTARVKELELQVKREFRDREMELIEGKEEFWDKAYTELGLDPDGEYEIDKRTGIVIEVVEKEKKRPQNVSPFPSKNSRLKH